VEVLCAELDSRRSLFHRRSVIYPYIKDFYATQRQPSPSQIAALQFLVRAPSSGSGRILGLPRGSGTLAVAAVFSILNGVALLPISLRSKHRGILSSRWWLPGCGDRNRCRLRLCLRLRNTGVIQIMLPSTTSTYSSSLTQRSQVYRAIGWAGLLAGSLDITAALVESGLKGKSPVHLFQAIAGGLLGMSSFQGGLATAALGVFFHFLIATTASAVFYLASRKLKFLVKHAIPSGLIYGVMVYLFMYYFVLPISAYHIQITLPPMAKLVRDIAVHMFMVGLPISLVVRRYSVLV
jgi:hypothetical protein